MSSSDRLLAVQSIPPEGSGDRDAFITSMLVRIDALEAEVRSLKTADAGQWNKLEVLERGLQDLRAELVALRTMGDEQLRAIKTQLEDSAEQVGSMMRSQAKVEKETEAQTATLAEQNKTLEEQTKLLKLSATEQAEFLAALKEDSKTAQDEFLEGLKTEVLETLSTRLPPKWATYIAAFVVVAIITAFQAWPSKKTAAAPQPVTSASP